MINITPIKEKMNTDYVTWLFDKTFVYYNSSVLQINSCKYLYI